ncbi:MAG TPA: 4-(cytidine 5'-diphospho)-2-C-methyl-D-erythritol kinase [Flavipsychrobacter sp.]|nr:4-(cytidine 5'-diphospho)-2-C-methyl-D-erythritol kinase [Flavipsychrobacter sp.]
MLTFPNGKINLGLYITNRREDGYHDLETVFYPIALKDALEIVKGAEQTNLFVSGKAVAGSKEENIVWKAYELLRQQFPHKIPILDIYLNKGIPMGAGLGGGSADGAFMLKLLNDFCGLKLSQQQLAARALELGSDCPFFIYNTPQFATGRGEVMQPVAIDLSDYAIQLVCPAVHISTAKAFRMLSPKPASFDLKMLPTIAVKDWKHQVSNDFEEPIFNLHPALKDVKQQLYNQGALYASLSGSGSTIFGIFPKGQKAAIQTDFLFEEYIL